MRSASFLKTLASRLIVAGAGVVLLRSAFSRPPDPPERSPHADALELVLKTQADVIRKAEEAADPGWKPDDRSWSSDTEVRAWQVQRPFSPGMRDSTHMFDIGYFIGGDEAAIWRVYTDSKQVVSHDPKGKGRELNFDHWDQTGVVRDINCLRNKGSSVNLEAGMNVISSDKARDSASRVFDRIRFIGMSRDDVVWILGSPFSIGGLPREDEEGSRDPMIYRFVGEQTGDEYRLFLKENRVVEVQRKAVPGARKL